MALNDISLTAGMRTNLLSLQSTTTLLNRTQERLSSGKKVNTALDNPTNFFAAQGHTQRAADLTTRKDGMTEAVQGVQAANKGITAITALIEAAKGLTQAARSAGTSDRNALGVQYNTILTQITQMAGDSGYKGKNFLKSDFLNVLFNENGASYLAISGFDATATGLGVNTVTVASVTAGITGTATTTGFQTVSIVTHTATLSTALPAGSFAASTSSPIATGEWNGSAASGVEDMLLGGVGGTTSGIIVVNISGVSGLLGGSTFSGVSMYTGAIKVDAVVVEGIRFGADGSIAGVTGSVYSGATAFSGGFASGLVAFFNSQLSGINPLGSSGTDGVAISSGISGAINFTGTYLNNITGIAQANGTYSGINFSKNTSLRFELSIGSMNASGEVMAGGNNLVYNMATGDIASGANILASYVTGTFGADNKTKLTGLVMVDGAWADPANYTIGGSSTSGFTITFITGAAPTLGKVTYAYNSGFTSGDAAAKLADQIVTLTGQTLTTGQAITEVIVGGTTLTTGYTVSGNIITLSTGLASGTALTYKITTTVGGGWSGDSGIDNAVNELNTAIATLRTQSSTLASNLSVVTIRQDFTDGMVNVLLKGADNLTLADMNEEGANMLMLQTRQQLGTTSLKMASDAAQSVLRLF